MEVFSAKGNSLDTIVTVCSHQAMFRHGVLANKVNAKTTYFTLTYILPAFMLTVRRE